MKKNALVVLNKTQQLLLFLLFYVIVATLILTNRGLLIPRDVILI